MRSVPTSVPVSLPITATVVISSKPEKMETGMIIHSLIKLSFSTYLNKFFSS